MKSRWRHRAELHVAVEGEEHKATWLELFYDLIYVAALIQLGNALSHHVSMAGFAAFAAMFTPLWLAWTTFTFYSNRFVLDDFWHRILVFGQMFAVGSMAVSVPEALDGGLATFARAYAALRFLQGLAYLRTSIELPDVRQFSQVWLVTLLLDAGFWLAGSYMPAPWNIVMYVLGTLVTISVAFWPRLQQLLSEFPPDHLHMSERYGLLTLIVLGESFVKILSSLFEAGASYNNGLLAIGTGVITVSLWWIYFDDVAGSAIKKKRLALIIWVYAHLPFTLAVTAVGVATKKVVFFDIAAAAPDKYRWLLCGTLALAFFWVGVVDWVTERRQAHLSDRNRVIARFVSAGLVLLLAPVGRTMPAGMFVALVAGFSFLQVILDLIIAPESAEPERQLHSGPHEGHVRTEQWQSSNRKSSGVVEVVRKGAPSELRRDLYFYLIESSWTVVLVALASLFVLVNFVFACLYVLDPAGVSAVGDGSLMDAFFFSVQTMSTIGYGVMAPQSQYAHILVTVEAGLSILGTALATGIMFAKAATPKSSVLFSNSILVSEIDGCPTLCFRVANGRGNEVVDATMNLNLLMDMPTQEGQSIRRVLTLDLVRDSSPIFTLSWLVMHRIEEGSPLYGMSEQEIRSRVRGYIATMNGHDSTYAQTVYARHMYREQDLYFGYSFVDVITDLDAGRMLLDYTCFHDIKKDRNT